MKKKFQSLKILVTGASGFIGRHLVGKLLSNKYEVICMDLRFTGNFISEFGDKVEMIHCNLVDKELVAKIVCNINPSFVFHLAGYKNRKNTLLEFKTSNEINYLGTLNLFEALLECKKLKIITIMGTIEEYGNAVSPFKEDTIEIPNSAYGLSKLTTTKLAIIFNRQFNLPVTVLRPSIAYGSNQGDEMFIPALIMALLRNENFKMTKGEQLRDFIFIEDLTDALLKTLYNKNVKGQIINIAAGKSDTLKTIALEIEGFIGSNGRLKIGGMPYRRSEIMNYEIDISKASKLLNWTPKTSLKKGLKKTVNYYISHLIHE